jgi:hypothetical protein
MEPRHGKHLSVQQTAGLASTQSMIRAQPVLCFTTGHLTAGTRVTNRTALHPVLCLATGLLTAASWATIRTPPVLCFTSCFPRAQTLTC